MTGSTNMVSGGRNPNRELTCGFPQCRHLIHPKKGSRDGGWCGHPANRVPPEPGWPNGFTPSVASTGGCDLHTLNVLVGFPGQDGKEQDETRYDQRIVSRAPIQADGTCQYCGRDYSGDMDDADLTVGGPCPAEDCPSNVEMKGKKWSGGEAIRSVECKTRYR